MRTYTLLLVFVTTVSWIAGTAEGQRTQMALFTINQGFSSFPNFGAESEILPGTPILELRGNNAINGSFPGVGYTDIYGNEWAAGDAFGYEGDRWIGNSFVLHFDRGGFDQIEFSYDYFALADSGATSGIRAQGASTFSQTQNVTYESDGQWHRVTHSFNAAGLPDQIEIGTGPNATSGPGLRIDNLELVARVPEPTAFSVLSVVAICAIARRRNRTP